MAMRPRSVTRLGWRVSSPAAAPGSEATFCTAGTPSGIAFSSPTGVAGCARRDAREEGRSIQEVGLDRELVRGVASGASRITGTPLWHGRPRCRERLGPVGLLLPLGKRAHRPEVVHQPWLLLRERRTHRD